jgi:thiamine biosynthesis lipoprotein
MKLIFKIIALTTTCYLLSTALCGCQDKKLYKDTRLVLGTYIEVTSPDKRATKIVFDEISRIEDLLSKYRPESEVSELNRLGKLKVSPETFYIIKKSKEFSEASYGAFDITVAPLMDLWGFTNKEYRVPKDSEIKNTMKLIGSDKIVLNELNSVIEFSVPGMKIDLGGIAKGFAIDCAVKKLREKNISSCLIAGGQVYALGDKFAKPWRVTIKSPRERNLAGYLELKDQSAATSGDYEQYFTKNGKKYSHIMDPRSGYPADSGISSVTVIAQDGLTADALSTAVSVLGKGEGEKLAAGLKVKCLIR